MHPPLPCSAIKAQHRDRAAYHLLQIHRRAQQAANKPSSSPTIGNDTSSTSTSTRTGYRGDALLGGVTSRLLDRLLDVRARSFPNVLLVGGAGAPFWLNVMSVVVCRE